MKTIKTVKNHKCYENQCYVLPLKISSPSKATQHYFPFLTGMAKGLRLVSKAINLGYQQVDLVLDSYNAVGMLSCYILKAINPLKYDLKSIKRS